MNNEMAYLLGMIMGNGKIKRVSGVTTVSISIPHRKLLTESNNDVRVYVKASVTNIRQVLEPLLSKDLSFVQNRSESIITFTKNNEDYLIREILQFVDNAGSCEIMRIPQDFYKECISYKIHFLRGFADVAGYVRRSNYYFNKHKHRVYIEILYNWYMVADICNLLASVNIPVQNIDWAHPNIRDGKLTKYNQGNKNFWKKEHQIKIWANEFIPIGFEVIHKNEALNQFSKELIEEFKREGKTAEDTTHRFYWDVRIKEIIKPSHPAEGDSFIPKEIRGRHYDSWQEIAKDLGYKE